MMNSDNRWGDMAQLRIAAESLADAINLRTRVHNRVRSGSADPLVLAGDELLSEKITEKQIALHPLGKGALDFEQTAREGLRDIYEQTVPAKVREWAQTVPIIASGELFPRICGLVGNPRHAVPLRMEGTGKDRTAIPDGEPYGRSLRQLWQWCGCGDPDLTPEAIVNAEPADKQAVLLRRGKVTTVKPLLFTFSERLQMAKGKPNVSQHEITRILLSAKADAAAKRHCKVCRNRHRWPLKPNGCGTTAHPEWGEPGSPWRPGHQQAHAFRIAQKELLRAYWIAAEDTEW
jgi:hypothetical protein